jgi:drug/metabolite transporter (DMT)-like permease
MSLIQLTFIISTVLALSAGQILFKLAAASFSLSSENLLVVLLDIKLIAALFVYLVATVMWLFVLKAMPLRIAYPFVALAFIFVPIMAHVFLGEDLNWNTFLGAAIIAFGVWVSVYD